jgi:hypothetical protein
VSPSLRGTKQSRNGTIVPPRQSDQSEAIQKTDSQGQKKRPQPVKKQNKETKKKQNLQTKKIYLLLT